MIALCGFQDLFHCLYISFFFTWHEPLVSSIQWTLTVEVTKQFTYRGFAETDILYDPDISSSSSA